jgi:hypothetical protein
LHWCENPGAAKIAACNGCFRHKALILSAFFVAFLAPRFVASSGIESLQGKYLNANGMWRILPQRGNGEFASARAVQVSNRIDRLTDWMDPAVSAAASSGIALPAMFNASRISYAARYDWEREGEENI